MEKGFVENGFIIDLSTTKNTTQLVFELSSIMEHPDVKEKNVCLKLGNQDLKQSQLLSIKALIESMDAQIAFIETDSEQTEASAVSLGMIVSKLEENVEIASYIPSEKNVEVEDQVVKIKESYTEISEDALSEVKTVEVVAESSNEIKSNPITTLDGVTDVYTEETTQEVSEIIPVEHFDSDFEKLAASEGLISKDDLSKYIILDTGDVLPEGVEENSVDTKMLPTLYLNQTLRSGQTVNYEGNILIIGDAHPGSEIVAEGDITVWGILGGIAHAGAKGNITAKVRALKLNAIQLRIAGLYARRNDTLNVPYVQKTNEFTPEEAQIEDGKIVIYKKLRRD
ncbi:septum site-determining protein MinC [bacterium]|nr:septum site-determining protein MinC [bacterium]